MLGLCLRRQEVPALRTALTDNKTLKFILHVLPKARLEHQTAEIGPLLILRTFATSNNGGSGSQGPVRSKIRAIPFTVSPTEALEAFNHYHSNGLLSKHPSGGLSKQKEAFLPFWVTSATLQASLRSAEVGDQKWTDVFNSQTRRFERQLKMHYRQVAFNVVFERSYPAGAPDSAVYGSWKYPRRSIAAVVPLGPAVLGATLFTSDLLNATSGAASMRRVGPFEMRPAAASAQSMKGFQQQEHRKAREWIQQQIRCDEVRLVDLEIAVLESHCSPVYTPCYIFQSRHLGDKVHTFVSGCMVNAVGGTRMLDELRVGALAGAAATAAIVATGAWKTSTLATLLWTWVVPPAVVAALAARVIPRVMLQLSRAFQAKQRDAGQQDSSPWDEEFVSAFDKEFARRCPDRVYQGNQGFGSTRTSSDFEDFVRRMFGQETPQQQQQRKDQRQRERQWQWQQQQTGPQQRPHTGDPGDPGGYYKRLNVHTTATKSEIQAAFRGVAQRWHPDHVEASQKDAAAVQFRKAVEAYSVLRDGRKRADYDRGIY